MKIAVAGTGYVGLSLAVLLAQQHEVVALDIVQEKVDKINSGHSPISDPEIEDYLAHNNLNLTATVDKHAAYDNADFVIIATPTDYDPETNFFNTSTVEAVINDVTAINPEAVMVIKSTIPVGLYRTKRRSYLLKICFFHLNFYGKGRRFMITYIHPALWLVSNQNVRKYLQIYYWKAQKT